MATRLNKIMEPILKQKCNDAYKNGFQQGLEAGFAKKQKAYENEIVCLKAALEGRRRWVPVEERLPEYEEPVMGWDAEYRNMGIVNFVYGKFLDIIDLSETNITHWMPLPEPPKEENHGKAD